MNYFGHAAIACHRSTAAPFILGAMLPDLCAMAGVPAPRDADAELADGMAFHVLTDAVFHQTETFLHHNRRALLALRGLGVSRGPARACAHMGVELLIDAELVNHPRYVSSYEAALLWGVEELTKRSAEAPCSWSLLDRVKLKGLFHLLLQRESSIFDRSFERLRDRLHGALVHRERLRPSPSELACIASWLASDAHVSEAVPRLLLEMKSVSHDVSAESACPSGNRLHMIAGTIPSYPVVSLVREAP
jgi:hypothetical protein